MITPRNLAVTGVTALVAIGVVGAAVPLVSDWYQGRHTQNSSYTSARDAKNDQRTFPRWVPDAATDVKYQMRTTGGDRLVRATLPSASLPADCTPYKPSTDVSGPALKAAWFPEDTAREPTTRCGQYYVSLQGSTLYAWQTDADWIAENKARRDK
ncbi:hypothetical protein AB0467_15475 [Streptomyces sp. NPDC052095]|uniref:hypothetical protein n=1 Tax=unclassified Streptomyces TaxID=2593676 RepID=UPI00344F014C